MKNLALVEMSTKLIKIYISIYITPRFVCAIVIVVRQKSRWRRDVHMSDMNLCVKSDVSCLDNFIKCLPLRLNVTITSIHLNFKDLHLKNQFCGEASNRVNSEDVFKCNSSDYTSMLHTCTSWWQRYQVKWRKFFDIKI